ncbi:aminoglycoside phosphotransferase family protein [Streptomyces pinistramenti]|uniref:aminoglycoside phosphotransferase family protein n=1 Tax=Streptomyces pinistramenti TaxID=2884812 RepID=UPI001D087986|nr:aminoglycoside phosphotransferase family protein [Streptomyces pinistramenti]MCB5910228.1 aminoglycoside phosphotransferase family protein [Streptomyces pinistramenti]
MERTRPDDDRFPARLSVIRQMGRTASGRAWLDRLPGLVRAVEERWELRLGAPFDGGTCAWVAPAELPDGTSAVLKVTWPHREAEGEAPGLCAWDGSGAVRLLRHDRDRGALLIERCTPGTTLATAALPPEDRLVLAAGVLRALWSAPAPPDGVLEPVELVCAEWADLVQERMLRLRPGYDPGLVELGARLLRTLPAGARREVVVHGDANPGNVLAARRSPWLAIDPKPMTGDPAYDPWPLLAQIDDPFTREDPRPLLRDRCALLADALDEDPARLAAWAVARSVESALHSADHDDVTGGSEELAQARILADLAGC